MLAVAPPAAERNLPQRRTAAVGGVPRSTGAAWTFGIWRFIRFAIVLRERKRSPFLAHRYEVFEALCVLRPLGNRGVDRTSGKKRRINDIAKKMAHRVFAHDSPNDPWLSTPAAGTVVAVVTREGT